MRIELSQHGIRIPYLRFLADAAVGYLAIAIIVLAIYSTTTDWGQWSKVGLMLGQIRGGIGRETKVFLLLITFFLAAPLGLLLNAVGWFLLGWTHTHFAGWWRRAGFAKTLTAATQMSYLANEVVLSFSDTEGHGFYRSAQYFEEILRLNSPQLLVDLEHMRGLKRLVRSISLVALLMIAGLLPNPVGVTPSMVLITVALVGCLLAGLIEYSECVKVFLKVYCLLAGDVSTDQTREEITFRLINELKAIPSSSIE